MFIWTVLFCHVQFTIADWNFAIGKDYVYKKSLVKNLDNSKEEIFIHQDIYFSVVLGHFMQH